MHACVLCDRLSHSYASEFMIVNVYACVFLCNVQCAYMFLVTSFLYNLYKRLVLLYISTNVAYIISNIPIYIYI